MGKLKINKEKLGNVLRGSLSFLSGVVGSANPVLGVAIGAVKGVVEGVKKTKDKNLSSKVGGIGKVDVPHASGTVIGYIVIGLVVLGGVAVAAGWITMDQLIIFMGMLPEVPVDPIP